MTETLALLQIPGLGAADAAELRLAISDLNVAGDVRIEKSTASSRRLGEPVTFILIGTLTLATLKIVTSFLLKPRKRTKLTYNVEVINADGSRRVETLQLDQSESDNIDSDVINALARITGLPTEEIKKAIETSENDNPEP